MLRRAERPVTELLQIVVGVGTDHGDGLHLRRIEREQAVVLEEYEALACGGQIDGAMVGPRDLDGGAVEVGTAGIFEETHAELQREQAGAGRVDFRLGEAAAAHGLDGSLVELRGGHHDVVASAQRHDRGIGVGGADLLLPDEAPDVVPVGHDHAAEAPLVLEDVDEQPAVGGRRHAFDRLVAGHEGHRTGTGGALERRQEVAPQLAA